MKHLRSACWLIGATYIYIYIYHWLKQYDFYVEYLHGIVWFVSLVCRYKRTRHTQSKSTRTSIARLGHRCHVLYEKILCYLYARAAFKSAWICVCARAFECVCVMCMTEMFIIIMGALVDARTYLIYMHMKTLRHTHSERNVSGGHSLAMCCCCWWR